MPPSRSTVMAYCLCYVSVNSIQTLTVRISFLVKHLILETSKAQNSLEKTERSVILQEIIPLVISLKQWSNSNSEKSFAPAIAFQMTSCIEYVSL